MTAPTPEPVDEPAVDDDLEELSGQEPDGLENPYRKDDFDGDQDVPDEELPDA